MRGTESERGREPPVAGAEREHAADQHAGHERAAEQHAPRHRLHDLEVAEAARQLDGADRPIHQEQVARAPRDGHEQDQSAHQSRDVARSEVGSATRHARRPRPLRGLERDPATSHEQHHQHGRPDGEAPPVARSGHGRILFPLPSPWVASQPSTSAR